MAKTRQSTRASNATEVDQADKDNLKHVSDHAAPKKKLKIKHESEQALESVDEVLEYSQPKTRRKRKTKNAEIDVNPFISRADSPWKIGAHVSAAGGVENAVTNAAAIGGTAFALFLKSQRKWESPPLKDTSIAEFKNRMKEFGYSPRFVLPHGSYLINLGNPDLDKREKSYACFLDDLKRCEALGLELYNFHPGSTVGETTLAASLAHIADCINRAHKETDRVTVVLENMAGAGNVIGSDFAHLAGIIERVEDKTRVGVCLDTCHAFAAGYDIRTQEGWNSTITKFDDQVGLKYLCGMHLNDSKTACNSKRDRHENIGLGHLGLLTFQHIVTDPRTQNIPLILETPSFEQPAAVWGKEIGILQRVSGAVDRKSPNLHSSVLDLDALVQELRKAVKGAESSSNKGGAKTKTKGTTKGTAKARKVGRSGISGKAGSNRKRKAVEECEEADEDDEEADEESG